MAKEDYRRWLAHPGMPEELRAELVRMSADAQSDAFYRDLAFGTGGLRGEIGAGTNRMNVYTVSKATRGLGRYLLEAAEQPSCAVSYDSRIHSRDFARLAAATLAQLGVRVRLYPQLQPTPMLSYAVRHEHCDAGVMITASHNPAKFNGYKVYGSDGCQITLEVADRILRCMNAEETLVDQLPDADFDRYLESGMISYITDELIEDYYRDIRHLSVAPCDTPLHVVYSPLNGTGNVPVREMLRRMGNVRVDVVAEQELPHGCFPTAPYPNPEIREAMRLAIAKCAETGADLCIATDPDCDRIGAGVRVGDEVTLISGNDMGVLLLDYIAAHTKREPGSLPPVAVKTIVTTEMAVPICRKYGVELRNVLTGFKFIGEQIALLEKDGQAGRFLFGFEESYGYLSGTDVRDKDAVNAALLVCEMAAQYKAQGLTLLDRLAQLRQEHGCYAQRLLTYQYEGESGAKQMAQIMASLRAPTPAQKALAQAERIDYLHDATGLPASDVLSFLLPSGFKVIVRPSGTEPKLKAYLFARGEDQAQAESALDALEQLMNSACMP